MTPAQLKFLKIVQQKQYFAPRSKVLVALSGGLDSMTLFNWLYDLQDKLEIKLGIAHINHGLREESKQEEAMIYQIAQKLNVPVYVDKFTGKFTEEKAREFRYQFFKKIMNQYAYTILVTAHHKGDVVETVLMREVSGRPLKSLQGIEDSQPFASGHLVRPLLQFDKSELEAPVFFEDRTNQGTDYFRNRIRNQLIPEMTKENPRFSEAILDLSTEINLAMTVIKDKILELDILGEKVSVDLFCKQSSALQHFILQAYFAQFPVLKINKRKFEELLHLINRPQQYHKSLNKNLNFVKTKEVFYIEKKMEKQLTDLSVQTEDPQDDSYSPIYLPAEGTIEIRKRQPGDQILINGHHKKLRKFFIDQKVPLEKRENPLIFVENQLYIIVDVACSDLSKQAKNDKMRRTLWVKPNVREEKHDAPKKS